ncbi:hypothetical protein V7S43_013322 [Phytophthora oleae]|uniref:Crinkler (CRN) family protein n=1 Tax=Phytophthora oleae TaxID=2107226 RepID=A0ABD3F428_9STRA
MTGKTSLAALVSRFLVNRCIMDNKKMVLFNFSALGTYRSENFEEIFKEQCSVAWKDAVSTPPQAGYVVYLVLDEAQGIYSDGTSSLGLKATIFWEVVKAVLNDTAYSVRILMFAVYGAGVQYPQFSSPVQLDARFELGIEQLNFSQDLCCDCHFCTE